MHVRSVDPSANGLAGRASVQPNVEVTGPRRQGTLAARRKMCTQRLAARVPCRSASG